MTPNANLLPHVPSVSDLTTVAVLLKWFPLELVEKALEVSGRESFRLRSLPAELMVYYALVMSLHKDLNSSEVLRIVLEGADRVYGKRGAKIPTKSGISHARSKIGADPLKLLFRWVCKPIAQPGARGSFFRNWRLVALDGCLINVADTQKNLSAFGRPSNQSEKSTAYPQIRMVCLAECGTHVIFDMATGGYRTGEITLAKSVIPSLQPGMLCLMDRLFFGFDLWKKACATGAAQLWRVKTDVTFVPQTTLADGSYTALYFPSPRDKENKDNPPIVVRVIDYEVTNAKSKKKEIIRLVTNILEPAEASAAELAKLYMQRWEIELTYGEIKVRLNCNEVFLRSGTPELIEQELYGLILAHYSVRCAIYEAASKRKRADDPDDFSFISAVRIIRRKMLSTGGFSP